MAKNSKNKASLPNPALRPLSVLVGQWKTVGTHPYLPGKTLRGQSSFQWIEGGAFLRWHSKIEDEHFPEGIAIFGSDDATGELFMLYFDERQVSRKYDVTVQDNLLQWWRNAPRLSQRYTWTFTDRGHTIIGKGELSKDGTTWEQDLDLTYTRVKPRIRKRTKAKPARGVRP